MQRIKFTSFGVPYLAEFENVAFAHRTRDDPDDDSFCYVETPLPLFTRTLPPDPRPPPPSAHGIHIQFPAHHPHSQLTRKKRLVRLQEAITGAVLDIGMSRSPAIPTPKNPSTDDPERLSRGQKTPDAFFCGTYGQMMAAFEAASLSVTPCLGDGLSGRAYFVLAQNPSVIPPTETRLGALFVARNNGTDGVQLTNITLWG